MNTLRICTSVLIIFLIACSSASAAPADVIFRVTTTADVVDDNLADTQCHTSAGTCSLRAAVMQANRVNTADVQVRIYVPAGTYLLTRMPAGFGGDDNGDLNLTSPLGVNQDFNIIGAGPSFTIIDGNRIDRVLRVGTGRSLTVLNLTIRNGSPAGNPSLAGGGIYTDGTLTLSHSVIEGNTASNGGGVHVSTTGTLNVDTTTIRSNVATLAGGGLNVEGAAAVRESTLNNNTAKQGGGIYVSPSSNHLYVTNSTLSANVAYTNGGGIYNQSLTAIYSASIIGNDADHDQDQNGGNGGGVYNYAGSRMIVANTLIEANTLGNVPVYDDCSGTLEVYGWNLFFDVSGCAFSGLGNSAWGFIIPSTVGPLRDNGGPTWTHALLAGSRAIDTTDAFFGCVDQTGAPLGPDQRDAPRVAGAHCDVGAYEYASYNDYIFRETFEEL